MIVISDSNIIFSCFYTPNGVMANILKTEKKIQFIAPSYLLDEVDEHLPYLMKKNNLTKRKATAILKEITKNITFFDMHKILKKHRERAIKIAQDIDLDDYPFVALHLQTGHKIWTCDKVFSDGLKEKGYDICITTKELKAKLYKNNKK